MKTNQIEVGQKVKHLATRTIQTVKAYRPARKDHFGDILTPATVVFETPDGTCWDDAGNFEVVR